VTIDKDNLVLPELRNGFAALEDEVLQLSPGGAELVAFGGMCGSRSADAVLTAKTHLREIHNVGTK
jgi:hypothetical protein